MKAILKRIEHQKAYIEEVRNSSRSEERKAELIESAEGVIIRMIHERSTELALIIMDEHMYSGRSIYALMLEHGVPMLAPVDEQQHKILLIDGELPRTRLNRILIEPLPVYDPLKVIEDKHAIFVKEQNKLRARHSHKKG